MIRQPRRSILLHGLRLVVTQPGALLWTYLWNLAVALLFSLRLHAQLSSILDHSFAAERLNSAFDLGTLATVIQRLSYMAPSTGGSSYAGLPLYLLGYFLLVPGTLFCYQAKRPSRLHTLLSSGISFFWRFFRITLLTALISAIILVPLALIQGAWSTHVDNQEVELSASLHKLPGLLVIFLVAALLRLYFDLVEVYTVQLADRYLPNGKPDRRVRRTLLPAFRALRQNLARAYLSFLTLTLLGFAAFALTARVADHTLAQPRVWPQFLLFQAGLFCMMATRFWQRGAETILASDNPIPPATQLTAVPAPPIPPAHPLDPQPDPEPAPPSLSEPDPGVFHRDQGSGSRDQD
jgi:hypothetical protein